MGSKALDFKEDVELTRAALTNPAIAPVAQTSFESIGELFQQLVPDTPVAPNVLVKRFGETLRAASARALALDRDYYAPLEAVLTAKMGDGERRNRAWRHHTDWIRSLFETQPIFSPDGDQALPLAKVYQRLRCFWHEEIEENDDKADEAERRMGQKTTRKIAHVDDLHGMLRDWIDKEGDSEHVRVIAGGPGSGKSTFAKAFALEASEHAGHRVVFVELQHFNLSSEFPGKFAEHITSPARHNEHDPNGSAGFYEDPLSWRIESTDPVLLVFDGLDELSASDDVAKELSRTFIGHVTRYLASLNAGTGGAVRAIILGRSAACQEALKQAGLRMTSMLHVAPLKPLVEHSDVGLSGRYVRAKEDVDILDPKDLRKIDQRIDYWERWAKETGLPANEVPSAIASEDLAELNVEPLLLHLLIISGYIEEDKWRDAVENRNRVYQAIFEKIFARDQNKPHQTSLGLTVDQRFTVLECLGLAAWRGGGRTGDDEEYSKLLSLYAPALQRKVAHADRLSQQSVAVQFYTRKGEDAGFEFIHKSFSEYLTARALLAIGIRSARQMSNEDDPAQPEAIARNWTNLIDAAELTDEARLPDRKSCIADTKVKLTELFNWSLINGMPVQVDAGGYRHAETRQRCSETAVLSVLSAVARTQITPVSNGDKPGTAHLIPVEWPDADKRAEQASVDGGIIQTPRQMIQSLWISPDSPMRNALSCLVMPAAWLERMYLVRANLRGADLRGADLRGADLRGAECSRVNIESVRLHSAILTKSQAFIANCCQFCRW